MRNKESDPRTATTGAGQSESLELHSNSTPSTRLFKSKEAARHLGIGERLLWSLTNCGEVASIRIGSRAVRYSVDDLNAYIARRRKGGPRR